MRVLLCSVKKIITVHQKAKRPSCQPREAASVPGCEWQFESIRRGIQQPLDAVSREVVILSLLSTGDNRRTCGLKQLDRLPNGFLVKGFKTRIRAPVPTDCINQFQRPRNASYRLRWENHLFFSQTNQD